jgi:hypothetical protein
MTAESRNGEVGVNVIARQRLAKGPFRSNENAGRN